MREPAHGLPRATLLHVDVWDSFEIVGSIRRIQLIARGEEIRDLVAIQERFGTGDWLKLKGSQRCASARVRCMKPSFTGMKPTASECGG